MHFSHLILPRAPQAMALYSTLVANPYVEHQELWSMLGAAPDAQRDFLYRSDLTERGFEIHALSQTPLAPSAPWVSRTRPYEVAFKAGQLLAFSMRVNPTYDKAQGPGLRSKRTDMVMERYVASDGQVSVEVVAQAVAQEWMDRRAQGSGFKLVDVSAGGYTRVTPTKKGVPMGKLARLDIEGTLVVTNPDVFGQKVRAGFGKAKFSGCGLMLLRRPT